MHLRLPVSWIREKGEDEAEEDPKTIFVKVTFCKTLIVCLLDLFVVLGKTFPLVLLVPHCLLIRTCLTCLNFLLCLTGFIILLVLLVLFVFLVSLYFFVILVVVVSFFTI